MFGHVLHRAKLGKRSLVESFMIRRIEENNINFFLVDIPKPDNNVLLKDCGIFFKMRRL